MKIWLIALLCCVCLLPLSLHAQINNGGGSGLPVGPTTPNNRSQLCTSTPIGGVAQASCTWALPGDTPTDRPSGETSYTFAAVDIGNSVRETNAVGETFTIPDGNSTGFGVPVNIGIIVQGGASTLQRQTASQIRCTPNGALANSCSLTVGAQYIVKETADFNYTLSVSGDTAGTSVTGCTSGCSYILTTADEPAAAYAANGPALASANQGRYVRFFNSMQRRLGNVCVNIWTASAGGHGDVGVYSVSGTTGTLRWHTGSFSTTSTGNICTTPTAYTMAAGANFYVAWCADSTTVLLTSFPHPNAASVNGGSGAPANTWGPDATDTCSAGVLPNTITTTNITNDLGTQIPYALISN